MPPVPAAGVPLNVLVAELNVTPVGNVPVCVTVALGLPVAVTVKLPTLPAVKVVAFALVIAGACPGNNASCTFSSIDDPT